MNTRRIRRDIGENIDAMVDEIIKHPERAGEVKQALRERMMRPDPVNTPKLRVVTAAVVASDDDCDLWDNVPV